MEMADWRFKGLKGELMQLGCEAAREVTAIVKLELGVLSKVDKLARPWIVSLLIRAGGILLPFDFETYMHYHFAKVSAQTRLMLDTWLMLAQKHGLKTSALARLHAELSALDTDK